MKKPKKSIPVHISKQPINVKVIPDPIPEQPLPTKAEINAQAKMALDEKLENDKLERYRRNVASNSVENQQGLTQFGDGVREDGMYDSQIQEIMKKHPEFKGVIAADEIMKLSSAKKMAFIINTDTSNGPGLHWTSCFIDCSPNVRSIEYFDPFGSAPPTMFNRDIKKLVKKINPETMLLYKVNKVKQQDVTTNTCGLHAMNFLQKRLDGKSFIEATGYSPNKPKDQSEKYEKEVEKKFDKYM